MTTTTTGLPSAPGSLTHFPWRFTLGQDVYIFDQLPTQSVRVVGGELFMGWPHLHVEDAQGHTWRIPQIHAMSKPLTPKLR